MKLKCTNVLVTIAMICSALAMIFLAITIGTLCGKDNNMQQTPYYGDPMYSMPNNGYNTQSQSGQSL